MLPIAAGGGTMSSLYYFLFSRAFDREHRGVVVGRRRYEAQERMLGAHRYLLRRNIHMLEKGLVMRPRRDVFAVDYIAPTVKCFRAMQELHAQMPELIDNEELRWAAAVLGEYFSIAGSHPTIDKVRGWWDELSPVHTNGLRTVPYHRDLDGAPPVRYEPLLRLAERRRSVRWFDARPVDRAVVDKALLVAAEAPSACNRQPIEFRVFDAPEMVARIAAIPMGTRGFAHQFPAITVLVGKLSAFFSERDRHLIYIDGSLAAMSFILALESLGLSSVIINWPDVPSEERAMSRLLQLEPDERVVMLIAFGQPDPTGMVPASVKKTLDSFRRYD
jgi:nitroreductase